MVNSRLHHLSNVVEASNLCATVELFKHHQSGENSVCPTIKDSVIFLFRPQDPPCKVLHYVAVLVLARTIISMKMEISFPQIECGESDVAC